MIIKYVHFSIVSSITWKNNNELVNLIRVVAIVDIEDTGVRMVFIKVKKAVRHVKRHLEEKHK